MDTKPFTLEITIEDIRRANAALIEKGKREREAVKQKQSTDTSAAKTTSKSK